MTFLEAAERALRAAGRPLTTAEILYPEKRYLKKFSAAQFAPADVLFASIAREYQNRALGIIMTGMGRDGAAKLAELYAEGSRTLGQDEKSSIVYGMPRVAWELGGVMEQVSLSDMALYFGSTTRTSALNEASALGSAPATSARPPVLINGTHSLAANSTLRGAALLTALILCCPFLSPR